MGSWLRLEPDDYGDCELRLSAFDDDDVAHDDDDDGDDDDDDDDDDTDGDDDDDDDANESRNSATGLRFKNMLKTTPES